MVATKQEKKELSNTNVMLVSIASAVFLIPIIIGIIIIMANVIVSKNNNIDVLRLLKSNLSLIFGLTAVGYGIAFYFVFEFFNVKQPKPKETLARSKWSTEKEEREFFECTNVNDNSKLKVGGSPVNRIGDDLLYCTLPFHDLCIGTTRSGKSRKLVRELVWLASRAEESMIFNDPKKEMYYDFKNYLVNEKGYQVYCLDLRNLQYSDNWNPLDTIIYYIDNDMIDDADVAAQDMVSSIVRDNGNTEPIWIEGQKALIKAAILAICQANIPKDKKNFYSIYQTMANTLQEVQMGATQKDKKTLLSAYMDSLTEDDIARTAWAAISAAPEKTRGSFVTSAMATLNLFSSRKLAKVMQKSDFDFKDFAKGKNALFIVNPDEKPTYDALASIAFDQAYQSLVFVANQTSDMTLEKRVHMILDEFGNMPAIERMDSKITVALSRKIIYHIYLQDYSQLDNKYDEKIAKTIKGNCNLKYFIASGDYGTCQEMADLIGKETIWAQSQSGSFDSHSRVTGGSISYQLQERYLKDPNELMSSDNRDGHGIIVSAIYQHPAEVYLPDCTAYPFHEKIKSDRTENVKSSVKELHYVIPRFFMISDEELSGEKARNDELRRRTISINQQPQNERVQLNEKYMFWFFATKDDIQEPIKNHIMEFLKEGGYELSRDDIRNYMRTEEFLEFLDTLEKEEPKEEKSMLELNSSESGSDNGGETELDDFMND